MPGMRASALSSVVLVCVAAFVAAAGCGEDEPPPKEEPKGDIVECDGMRCNSVVLPFGNPPIEACCPDGGGCGLDGAQFEQYGANFVEDCQPLNQPGVLDARCPDSPPIPTEQLGDLMFSGCCTAAGKCGYMLDMVSIITLGLGCVDSTPFLDGGVSPDCDSAGGGGAGGGAGQ
jgi:hypothetical protein